MRAFLAAVAFVFLISAPCHAQDKYMHIDLADDRVDITTGFNGTRIVLFGTTNVNDPNFLITLKGPERTMVVRQKAKALGTWVNRHSVEFRRVPSYYDYAVNYSDPTLAGNAQLLRENQIGVDNLEFYPEDADEDPETAAISRDALIRRMQGKGFYPLKPGTLDFVNQGFFKVAFQLPPGVPTGNYTVESILVENGAVISKESQNLQVGQVGFNARVYSFADDHSFLYGVFAVAIALISGWSAFTFLRRD